VAHEEPRSGDEKQQQQGVRDHPPCGTSILGDRKDWLDHFRSGRLRQFVRRLAESQGTGRWTITNHEWRRDVFLVDALERRGRRLAGVGELKDAMPTSSSITDA
jgi:hypothetical protein